MTPSERNEDAWLEELLQDEPIRDDGFTAGVMTRIRRREWFVQVLYGVSLAIIGLLLTLLGKILITELLTTELKIEPLHIIAAFVALGIFAVFWLDSESEGIRI